MSGDLFAHMFHFIARRLMVSSSSGGKKRASVLGGLISSCGGFELQPHHLSAVIGVSILLEVCCVHPYGAPHRGEALRTAGHQPQYSMFSPTGRKREADRQLCTLTHTEHRRQLPKAVGKAASSAPPFFSNIILTSSYMSSSDGLTTHPLKALSNQGLLGSIQ